MSKPSSARIVVGSSSPEATYQFLRRERHLGYLDTSLWLPKAVVNTMPIKRSLEFTVGNNEKLILWRETGDHLVVPRYYLDPGQGYWFDVVRREPSFLKVNFQDRIILRPDQTEAWAAFEKADHGILKLACGRGKSLLALKKIAQRGHPALVIVNQSGTLKQWAELCDKFLGITPGVVQGPSFDWKQPIVLATISTLSHRAESWPLDFRSYYGTVVVDEVHHLSAPVFSRIADLFWGARFGLSATPERDDGTEVLYYYHIGNVFHEDLTQDLTPAIYFQELETRVDLDSPKVRDCTRTLHMNKLRALVTLDPRRLELVAGHITQAVQKGRRILVLGHSVEGLQALQRCLGEGTVFIWRKTPAKKRLEAFRDSAVVLGTMDIASEALDAPALDTVFFVTPFKSRRFLIQGMGRILRVYPGKKEPIVVFFEDKFVPPLRSMCRKLRQTLTAEGYNATVVGFSK